MLWPVAALAGLLLTFVIVYGSIVQGRLDAGGTRTSSVTGRKRSR